MEKAAGQNSAPVREAEDLDMAYVDDAIRFFGWMKAFHLIGFCRLWLFLDRRPLAQLVTILEQRGMSKSTQYRLMRDLERWILDIERREGLAEGTLSPEVVAERLVRGSDWRG
jgi:hypothetical protein